MTHKVNWRTSLQPLLDYISRNTATAILYGLLFGAVILFYSQVVGGYVTLFLVILLGAYAFSMTISFKAMKKLEKYEKDGCLTFPRIVRLSFILVLVSVFLRADHVRGCVVHHRISHHDGQRVPSQIRIGLLGQLEKDPLLGRQRRDLCGLDRVRANHSPHILPVVI